MAAKKPGKGGKGFGGGFGGKGGGGKNAPKRPDGQIRQSQLVTTFGPGAMVDLVDRAVVIGGLEHWQWDNASTEPPLDDERLRRSLVPRLKALSPDLDLATSNYFRKPPECDGKDPSPSVGVRALEFPRWLVCQGCRRLGRPGDVFEPSKHGYEHQCKSNKKARAIPVRFVAACQARASVGLSLDRLRAPGRVEGDLRQARALPRGGRDRRHLAHPGALRRTASTAILCRRRASCHLRPATGTGRGSAGARRAKDPAS